MLFKKLTRTLNLYKVQFISMIIMLSLGIGVFVGFNIEWLSIEKNVKTFFEETGFADYRIINQSGFNNDSVEKLLHENNIKKASRYLEIETDVKDKKGHTIDLTITENDEVSGFVVMKGEKYDKESLDGIWLSKTYADKNNILLNDDFTLVYNNIEFKGKVKGFIKSGEHMVSVKDENQLMPDQSLHSYAYISPNMYKNILGYDYYPQINVISSLNKKEFTKLVNNTFEITPIILTKDECISYLGAKQEVEEGKTMGTILPVVFVFVAALTMVTTMHRIVTKEKTQIGTLKSLGFKDQKIILHYTSYSFFVSIIGVISGTILGYLIAAYILKPDGAMAIYLDIPKMNLYLPNFCIVTIILTIILLTHIGYLSVSKMLKGNAADALRPYTPKKQKKVIFEKFSFWYKLDFGARWNIRDSMRHKSRTFMSLIGVVGCAIIVLASLGMRDTMDAFLDLNYRESMLYNSKVNLSKDIKKDQINSLIDKYNGDSSSSISVQLSDKAVSLDVYNLPNNLVRFPDKDNKFVKVKDNGAFVSLRIADEFNLKVNDEISVKLYGTDEEYTIKVAGIIRSLSESIVMNSKYAIEINLDYKMDTIYTKEQKDNIILDNIILNVESKQSIIDTFDKMIEVMNIIITFLIVIGISLGIVVLYNLGIMGYMERYREMAALKVIGFKDKKIGQLLIGQNIGITILGIIIGIPLGIFILNYLTNELASKYEMKMVIDLSTYIITLIIIIGMSLIVSFMISRKNKTIDMVEALKGVD
jgi:putative ABC transport system permease protein